MITDIFCVTYAPDAEWLEFMLRSIDKYARGFRRTLVVFPESDAMVLAPICDRHRNVQWKTFPAGEDGHLDQNIIKTRADEFTDADQILHLDSDCVFTEVSRPEDFATNGKPDIWWEYYSNLNPGPVPTSFVPWTRLNVPWQGITRHALGFDVEVETMRRFPLLYPRWLYGETRAQIERTHRMPFDRFVRQAPCIGDAFHGYSEFNALGCMAYYKFPGEFELINEKDWAKTGKLHRVVNFWSHWIRKDRAKFDTELKPQLEKITEGYENAA